MDNVPTASIGVSDFYPRKIDILLRRLTERNNHSNDSVKPYLKNLVQMVDWLYFIEDRIESNGFRVAGYLGLANTAHLRLFIEKVHPILEQ